MFLFIMELSVLILGGLFMWSQIINPINKNMPIFPILRKTEKIKETIIHKNSELHNETLLDEVDQLETKIIEKKERRLKK